MTDLTISKERVLEAASKCSTAKNTLEILFPEVFVKKKEKLYYWEYKNTTDSHIIRSNFQYPTSVAAEKALRYGDEYTSKLVYLKRIEE